MCRKFIKSAKKRLHKLISLSGNDPIPSENNLNFTSLPVIVNIPHSSASEDLLEGKDEISKPFFTTWKILIGYIIISWLIHFIRKDTTDSEFLISNSFENNKRFVFFSQKFKKLEHGHLLIS